MRWFLAPNQHWFATLMMKVTVSDIGSLKTRIKRVILFFLELGLDEYTSEIAEVA
jgi:hypothetical protein